MFYLRKLYHSGQLGRSSIVEGSGSVRLLPVSVADEKQHQYRRDSSPVKRTINIESTGRALISAEGDVDANIVRVVLESLRG